MKKILVSLFSKAPFWNAPQWFIDKLQEHFNPLGYEVITSKRKTDYLQKLKESEILITWRLKDEELKNSSIKKVIFASAGYPDGFKPENFPNINFQIFPGMNREAVAEYALGLIFLLLKKYHLFTNNEALWEMKKDVQPEILSEKKVMILGLGQIGISLAKKLYGLDVDIIATKRNQLSVDLPCVKKIYHPTNIYEGLKKSDIVISCLPLNETTRHSIGEKEFFSIKKGGYFINVSRGNIIVENAIIKALDKGHLSGAALDVFQMEPLPKDHPFFKTKNLILTPHMAGNFSNYWETLLYFISQKYS